MSFRIYLFILFLHKWIFPACCFRQRKYMTQGLVNRVLNETWTPSLLQFEWFSFGYGFILRSSSFFLRSCLPQSALPVIDIGFALSSCVYVLVWFVISLTVIFFCLCVNVCLAPFFCCGCVVWNLQVTIFLVIFSCVYIYMYIYIYIYIYICPAWCFRQRTCLAEGLVSGVFNETWCYSRFMFECILLMIFLNECWSFHFLRGSFS